MDDWWGGECMVMMVEMIMSEELLRSLPILFFVSLVFFHLCVFLMLSSNMKGSERDQDGRREGREGKGEREAHFWNLSKKSEMEGNAFLEEAEGSCSVVVVGGNFLEVEAVW